MWDFGKGTPMSKSTLLKSLRITITTSSCTWPQNQGMCTRTKDIHFLCRSKPFVRDNTEGICGLESIRPDTSCPAEAIPHSQVEVMQAEIIGNRWLVNTPARTATLTYDQHDTATCIILPNQTLWITVPKGSILHIDELALYHLTDDEYQAEIEISPFFKQHSFILDPELEETIKEEGTQLIDLTPVDTALEAIARLPPESFLHYLQVIKLTDEQHLTQLAGQFPAMLLGYHRKETSKK